MSTNTEVKSKPERFEATALAHMDMLYRYALHMAQNESDARDLAQDTYLRAYRFFGKFNEATNPTLMQFSGSRKSRSGMALGGLQI